MNDKFFDLSKEKQDRMINAALKVFALYGYRYASTDDIVREAGVSKGLLFHYFGSKLGTYTFVYDYSVRYVTLELGAVDKTETELFALMRQTEEAHMRAMRGYPYMMLFLNRSIAENVSEALLATAEKREDLAAVYDDIYGRAAASALPAEVDMGKLRKTLHYTVTGLMEERFRDNSFQPEMFFDEVCGYLDMIKTMAYFGILYGGSAG